MEDKIEKTEHSFVVLAYKESKYLEECIKSVLNQNYKSEVVIATSTPNNFIEKIAHKYNLQIKDNPDPGKGIGYDFDFALKVGDTNLVTIAHQDDIYEKDYSFKIVEACKKNNDSIIVFSDYFEIREGVNLYSNLNLKIKRILLSLLRIRKISHKKIIKKSALAFGNAICCPAVTFVRSNIEILNVFESDMKCNIDWLAWERLSNEEGRFSFVNEKLMGHRVHEESTTTEIIRDNTRSVEDYYMFSKFWPSSIAKILTKGFKSSEKSNG